MTQTKTVKVLDICCEGLHLVCIMNKETNHNPYTLYNVWYNNGYHRKKLVAYQNFVSVIEFVRQFCFSSGFGFAESYKNWGKKIHAI